MNSQEVVLPYPRAKGIMLVLVAAILWGISGTTAQYLFHQQGFGVKWLVVIRLLSAGTLLLFVSGTMRKQSIWCIWKNKRDRLQLILFGVLGMLGVQYTYFAYDFINKTVNPAKNLVQKKLENIEPQAF